jgi:hypothetical protein
MFNVDLEFQISVESAENLWENCAKGKKYQDIPRKY